MNQEINTSLLFELRCIVLLEQEPQSNKYSQMHLDAEQFKTLTALLDSFSEKKEVCPKDENLTTAEYAIGDETLDLSNYSELKSVN
jgi:hypothetical protein